MKRSVAILSLVMLAAVPAAARVLSYAPYSDRTSLTTFHDRNTRHFALIEAVTGTSAWEFQQVVLYDSEGVKEPRVVFPPEGSQESIMAAALYEPRDIDSTDKTPYLYVVTFSPQFVARSYFSGDGGTTWKEVVGARGYSPRLVRELDFGGPTTLGMDTTIRNGNDTRPFIVTSDGQGVYAITSTGEMQTVAQTPLTTIHVIGQDRTGDRLLLFRGGWIEIIDLDAPGGNPQKLVQVLSAGDFYTGWITPHGDAYIQVHHPSAGRYLFLARPDETPQFILGPYDRQPASPLGPGWTAGLQPTLAETFAIPTTDFAGAWIVQRQPTKPTTLSRHTTASGLQQMWSDVSGPEVEALIAGESGEKVLIQVHRDRSVEMERPFLDPALAVWSVGDPAPRQYDELYLHEELNKGFVHVEVDRLADGDPFVFNSGALQDDGEIILSPGVGGGGDVIQEWGVVRGSLKQHLVLPGVARLNGAFHSRWLTDVTVYNPLETEQTVGVRYFALGQDSSRAALRQEQLTLGPREIRFIPDALHALFAVEDGGGALHFLPQHGMNVVARTYSMRADGGTFGFGMQAIDLYSAAGPRFPVTFAGAFPGQHFRTNVLITDTSGRGTEAALGAYGVNGQIGTSTHKISAPPSGILQYNGLHKTLALLEGDEGGLVIQPTRGTAITTVVAIDNRTNDATYFPPDVPGSDKIRTVPVIGHVDGAHGSHFRTDLYLFNPGHAAKRVTLEAKAWDSVVQKTFDFTLLPREARVITDALPTLFGMTGLARLRYWSDQVDGVRVTSRTYTVEESGATYGSLIPSLNNFQIAAPGDHLEILGVTGGAGFRTNIGLVELSAQRPGLQSPVGVYIMIFDQHMQQLDAFTVNVPSAGGMQINDVFQSRGITPPEAAIIFVKVADGGMIGAYATLTDNKSNDTTYLAAQLGAKEN